MPRTVIGVPVHNGARDLERCLRSLLAQDYPDLEILVSDNASTDATPDIAARFAAMDRRIRVIRQPHVLDMPANFSAVSAAADCEYFAWRAHDDWSDPDWARKLAALLGENAWARLAGCRTLFHDAGRSGKIVLDRLSPLGRAEGYARVKLALAMQGEWFYGLYRHAALRAIFDRTRAIYPNPWSQDLAVLLNIILAGGLICTNDTAFHSQNNTSSLKYRPAQWRDGLRDFTRFCRAGQVAIQESGLPLGPRLAFYLALPKFAGQHTEKPRRILRGWINACLGGTGATRRPPPRR
jgi:glycosyltransferase involved in cell wall biosynthesis